MIIRIVQTYKTKRFKKGVFYGEKHTLKVTTIWFLIFPIFIKSETLSRELIK